MLTDWKESYTVHNEIIDTQHKKLFHLAALANAMDARKATREQLSVLFKDFYNYMDEHFKLEEEYMRSINYPLLEEHKQLHENIIISMTKTLRETKTAIELQEKIKFLSRQWLVEHILENDLKIERWRKGNHIAPNDNITKMSE